jgi:hypothetical protein
MRNIIVICGLSRLADTMIELAVAHIPEQAADDWPDEPEEKISCRVHLCKLAEVVSRELPLWMMSSQINQVRLARQNQAWLNHWEAVGAY